MGFWRFAPATIIGSVFLIWLFHHARLKRRKMFTIGQFLRAAASGDVKLLTAILTEAKVPINRRNADGTTPLMLAVANGHRACAELLLRYGADPAIRRVTGTHALYFACQSGLTQMVTLLLRYSAPVDQPAYEGTTALFVAVEDNHVEIVQLLLQHHADVNKRAGSGYTPLMIAVKYNYLQMAEMLLERGADVNYVSKDCCSPLLLAVMLNYVEMARLLAEHGAHINQSTLGCDTPLLRAIRHGSHELVSMLLSFKPAPNPDVSSRAQSCLHAAVLRGDIDILRALLEAGHAVNSVDGHGYSEMKYAKLMMMQEIEKTLTEHAQHELLRQPLGAIAVK